MAWHKSPNRRKSLGEAGEQFARKLLEKEGYRILEKNYRCSLGEIDLIGEEGKVLVFIEVRTKSSFRFGTAAQSITSKKMDKLKKTALHYLLSRNITNRDCRIDVVALAYKKEEFEGELIRNVSLFY